MCSSLTDCTDEEVKTMFRLLGMNQQGIGTSAIEVWAAVSILLFNSSEQYIDVSIEHYIFEIRMTIG